MEFVTGHFMCTFVRDIASGSLGTGGLKDDARPFPLLPTSVKQLQLDLRWHVTNQSLVECNESGVNRSFGIIVIFLMLQTVQCTMTVL
jgi:hypothetical protein